MKTLTLFTLLLAFPALAQPTLTPEQIEQQAFIQSLQRKLSQAQTEAAQMEAVATKFQARIKELEAEKAPKPAPTGDCLMPSECAKRDAKK